MINKIKKREGYKIIILEPAKSRLKKKQCPSCGKPKSKWKRRKDWRCCCVKCTKKFEKYCITRSWVDVRWRAFQRDKFKCVKCGMSEKELNKWYKGTRFESYSTKLIGDHIKPIALGGKEFDLNNVQTLCIGCDKLKTKIDMGKIAKFRKYNIKISTGQRSLRKYIKCNL